MLHVAAYWPQARMKPEKSMKSGEKHEIRETREKHEIFYVWGVYPPEGPLGPVNDAGYRMILGPVGAPLPVKHLFYGPEGPLRACI